MSDHNARSNWFSSRDQHRPFVSKRQGAIGSAALATIESLESRRLLTVSPIVTGAPTANEGQDYVLTLSAPADAGITSWTIDWGDGTIATPDQQLVAGNPPSVLHKYVDATTPYHVTATASDGVNTFIANASGGGVTGTPDPGFAVSGKLVVAGKAANAVAVQADGKILVASASVSGFALTRYNADGTLDTFGTGGTVTTSFGGSLPAVPHAIAVQSDGQIVVAGTSFFGANQVAVARYNINGSLDTTFGNSATPDGKFVFRFVSPNSDGGLVKSVVIDNNPGPNLGKILLGGMTGPDSINGQNREMFVGRLNADGTADAGFGAPDGFAVYPGTASDQGGAIALQTDDKVVVVGENLDRASIIRFNADGSLDTGFNGTGRVATTGIGSFSSVAVDNASGNIIAAGLIDDIAGNSQWTVIRVGPTGTAAITFSPVLPLYNRTVTGSPVATPTSLVIQTDGKILVSGTTDSNGTTGDFATVRYNTDGSADTTFGIGGAVVTDFGTPNEIANAMALLPGGRILVAGGNLSGSESLILQQFGITASATPVTVFVSDVAPVVALINVPSSSPEGSAINASASVVDFTPANLTNTWAVTKNGVPFASDNGTAIHFVPTDNGTYVLTFTSHDSGGSSAVAVSTINVTNVAPTASVTADAIGAIGVRGQNRQIHIPVATDPSSVDTAAGLAYTVSWGDGTTTPIARTTLASDPGHIYQYDGNYHVTVTATDKDNGISAAVALNLAITPVALEGTTLAIGGLTQYDLLIITQSNTGGVRTVRVIDDFFLKYGLSESLFTRIDIYQATDAGTFVSSNVTDPVYLVDANGTVIETIHAANPGH